MQVEHDNTSILGIYKNRLNQIAFTFLLWQPTHKASKYMSLIELYKYIEHGNKMTTNWQLLKQRQMYKYTYSAGGIMALNN